VPIPLSNRARLDDTRLARLAAEVGSHTTLERVLHWGLGYNPIRRVEEIVTQDEYTHDVLVPLTPPLYLAYDVS
jgi:hypothetical protein